MKLVSALVLLGLGVLVSSYPVEYEEDNRGEYDNEPYVELVPIRRIPRRAVGMTRPQQQRQMEPMPYRERIMIGPSQEPSGDMIGSPSSREPIAAETGYGHSQQPYDYVDYGAYTGGYGAFGWYSDHPVHTYHGGQSY